MSLKYIFCYFIANHYNSFSFDELYRNALAGDLPSAIALVALEEAVNNNDDIEGAAEELDETLSDIIQLVGDYEDDSGGEK